MTYEALNPEVSKLGEGISYNGVSTCLSCTEFQVLMPQPSGLDWTLQMCFCKRCGQVKVVRKV